MTNRNSASFKDPAGYVFLQDGTVYRRINRLYQENFDSLHSSGLYNYLTADGKLVKHTEMPAENFELSSADLSDSTNDTYKIIRPEQIDFISYPYEWCFSQLKEAALLTLEIQEKALSHNMSLKDASAFNIQWQDGKPVLIDTLSFEKYLPGKPWIAYRQFCQHFLAPLALMSHVDLRLNSLLQSNLDGIPLDLASRMLPAKTWFMPMLSTHLHWHAKVSANAESQNHPVENSAREMGKPAMMAFVETLHSSIKSMEAKKQESVWRKYKSESYSLNAISDKKSKFSELVEIWQQKEGGKIVIDTGANTGIYSRLLGTLLKDSLILSLDAEADLTEANYLECRKKKSTNVLPLTVDLAQPTPALGFANSERLSLSQRVRADLIAALALQHHLSIGHHINFAMSASYFCELGRYLIIEFASESDQFVQKMMQGRADIFSHYTKENFERSYLEHFEAITKREIEDSKRILYLMKAKK